LPSIAISTLDRFVADFIGQGVMIPGQVTSDGEIQSVLEKIKTAFIDHVVAFPVVPEPDRLA
jgi:ABC-type Fe3+/spermidine/putrescine transport system ATPase subunit